MILIDGSHHEGGGQIIRTSFALAAITQQKIKIIDIRANRDKPGLASQHLTACLAVNEITQGNLNGAQLGAREITFEPGPIQGGDYHFNIGTAGSAILVAQTILPPLLMAKKASTVIIEGGTHLRKSPSGDYFQTIFLSALRKLGIEVQFEMARCGFFPRGGGRIILKIKPQTIQGNRNWPQDKTPRATIRLFNLAEHIAQREKQVLIEHGIQDITIYQSTESYSSGNSLIIWRGLCGITGMGERGKPAETVAQEAVAEFKAETEEVDKYLADQILLYCVLGQGSSAFKSTFITNHLLTNAYVINQFMERKIRFIDNLVEVI